MLTKACQLLVEHNSSSSQWKLCQSKVFSIYQSEHCFQVLEPNWHVMHDRLQTAKSIDEVSTSLLYLTFHWYLFRKQVGLFIGSKIEYLSLLDDFNRLFSTMIFSLKSVWKNACFFCLNFSRSAIVCLSSMYRLQTSYYILIWPLFSWLGNPT